MKNGLFINFEGIDGSGKTTQIHHFTHRLKNHSISYRIFREPGGTEIGEKIRQILLDKKHFDMLPITELLLYSASRYQLTCKAILPALRENDVVICDRFYDSTTAYQGYARGIDLDFIKQLNSVATESLVPDLTFFLDISLTMRAQRLGKKDLDRLELEKENFHKKVRNGFLRIAAEEPRRSFMIEGDQNPEYIAEKIWRHFLEKREFEK